jgi:hypothetical protein
MLYGNMLKRQYLVWVLWVLLPNACHTPMALLMNHKLYRICVRRISRKLRARARFQQSRRRMRGRLS